MYHKWRFIIKEEFREEEGEYVDAYYTDDEIRDLEKKYPEIKWTWA